MTRKFLASLLCLAALGGCATTPRDVAALPDGGAYTTPEQAVMLAADAAPDGVPGTFAMVVRATGAQPGRYYLNSQPDYRDQRNLTVVLSPRAHAQLATRLGGDPLTALEGQAIVVRGEAMRVRINFLENGRATGAYYYQTHVRVTDAAQVSLATDGP